MVLHSVQRRMVPLKVPFFAPTEGVSPSTLLLVSDTDDDCDAASSLPSVIFTKKIYF